MQLKNGLILTKKYYKPVNGIVQLKSRSEVARSPIKMLRGDFRNSLLLANEMRTKEFPRTAKQTKIE